MSNGRLYNLSHCTYHCEYHIVWTPRYRGRVLSDKYTKAELKRIFKQISKWKGFVLLAWHIGDEHIHLFLVIPPKFSVSYAVAILKAKSSMWIKKKIRKFPRGNLWCRGYFVSTVGIQEMAMRRYISNQDHHRVELQQFALMR